MAEKSESFATARLMRIIIYLILFAIGVAVFYGIYKWVR